MARDDFRITVEPSTLTLEESARRLARFTMILLEASLRPDPPAPDSAPTESLPPPQRRPRGKTAHSGKETP